MSGDAVAVTVAVPVPVPVPPPAPIQVQIPRAMSVSSVASGSMSPAGMCFCENPHSSAAALLSNVYLLKINSEKKQRKHKLKIYYGTSGLYLIFWLSLASIHIGQLCGELRLIHYWLQQFRPHPKCQSQPLAPAQPHQSQHLRQGRVHLHQRLCCNRDRLQLEIM